MSEFEDKLNAILSNPDAMAQVMNLAQSLDLGGGSGGRQGTAQNAPPREAEETPWAGWRVWGTCWGRSIPRPSSGCCPWWESLPEAAETTSGCSCSTPCVLF